MKKDVKKPVVRKKKDNKVGASSRIDPEVYEQLRLVAAHEGRTIANAIERAVMEWVDARLIDGKLHLNDKGNPIKRP